MSEHGAGSDLAAVQMRAVATDGGWLLNGTKVWTSGAHVAHQIVVLARTSPLDPQHRHAGFSQFIVPTDAAGITISPIELMNGEHHFNEVAFDGRLRRRRPRWRSARRGRQRLASGHRRAGLRTQWAGTDSVHGDARVLRGAGAGRPRRRRPDGRRTGRPDGQDDLAAPAVGVGGPRPFRRTGRRRPGRDGQGSRHPLRTGLGGTGGRPDRRP